MFTPVQDTLTLIPQRPPFVMVDTLTYSDEKMSRSTFRVGAVNILVENERLSEAGLIENIAQTAAARAGYGSKMENTPVEIGYIGAVNKLEIFSLPQINDELQTEIVVNNQVFNVTMIQGTIRCNNDLIAQCEMKIFITQTK